MFSGFFRIFQDFFRLFLGQAQADVKLARPGSLQVTAPRSRRSRSSIPRLLRLRKLDLYLDTKPSRELTQFQQNHTTT
jgi:hypothetical protein